LSHFIITTAMDPTANSSTSSISKPGAGWTNGDVPPQLYAKTQDGKLRLYSNQRRWIGLQSGWTRIGGDGHTKLDARHSSSAGTGEKLTSTDEEDGTAVRCLISQMCERFFHLGWATGTSGGVSIRIPSKNVKDDWRVFVTPSGIQKEDMIGNDIFELNRNGDIVVPSTTPGLRVSACTSLWYVIYKCRPSATCCIHTHSMNAVSATLLDPTEQSTVLQLTYLEMLKGVGNHSYDDILQVPIIDNRPTEDLLADQMEIAINKYPKCNAVLVRRHGLFVWGDSWEQAKTQCESFDYLFSCAIQMKSMGIDPSLPPPTITAHTDINSASNGSNKKRKLLENAFNGVSATDNNNDVFSNVTPVLPRDSNQFSAIILDIEGCTTSISFVTDVMFPYVRKHLDSYCTQLKAADPDKYNEYVDSLKLEVSKVQENESKNETTEDFTTTAIIQPLVLYLMDRDVKSASLKDLQGKMWKSGFESGELKGHVYPDTTAMLQWMKSNSIPVYIYSSGSIGAQKLLFGHSINGNLLDTIAGHFDITTAGPKKEAESYRSIAKSLDIDASKLIFVSDAEGELYAAKEGGIGSPIMSIRTGNAPLTPAAIDDFHSIYSLLQLCG
jgi:methylthioribulose 1-phosphate dehydratase / enolase-phosphatase E1